MALDDSTSADDTSARLRRFLLAYERLDAMWRAKFSLDADEKLVVLYLFEEAIAMSDVVDSIGVSPVNLPRVLDRLERDGFIRRIQQPDALALTKKGLRARLDFETTAEEMCRAHGGGSVDEFLEQASAVASRRIGELQAPRATSKGTA